jgi:hypothetical protein
MDMSISTGAGAIISNVVDYSKWLRSLLQRTGPLSSTSIDALLEPRTLILGEQPCTVGPHAYALGWSTGTYRGYTYFEHGGDIEAFGSQVSK